MAHLKRKVRNTEVLKGVFQSLWNKVQQVHGGAFENVFQALLHGGLQGCFSNQGAEGPGKGRRQSDAGHHGGQPNQGLPQSTGFSPNGKNYKNKNHNYI